MSDLEQPLAGSTSSTDITTPGGWFMEPAGRRCSPSRKWLGCCLAGVGVLAVVIFGVAVSTSQHSGGRMTDFGDPL